MPGFNSKRHANRGLQLFMQPLSYFAQWSNKTGIALQWKACLWRIAGLSWRPTTTFMRLQKERERFFALIATVKSSAERSCRHRQRSFKFNVSRAKLWHVKMELITLDGFHMGLSSIMKKETKSEALNLYVLYTLWLYRFPSPKTAKLLELILSSTLTCGLNELNEHIL